MNVVDHSYGLVDICRVSDDADHGYEEGDGWRHWLTDSLLGSSIRSFYNGRVFWNDGDGFHVYKSQPVDGSLGSFNYGQAKVSANFHAFAGSTLFVEEAFNEAYPENRIELLKRISPPTMDVSYPWTYSFGSQPRSGTCLSSGLLESGMSWAFSITPAKRPSNG